MSLYFYADLLTHRQDPPILDFSRWVVNRNRFHASKRVHFEVPLHQKTGSRFHLSKAAAVLEARSRGGAVVVASAVHPVSALCTV